MTDNFDFKKYLVENKLGPFSKLKQLNEEISPETIQTPAFDNATWKKTGKTKKFTVLGATRNYIIDSYMADGETVNNKELKTEDNGEIEIKEGFVFVESIGSQEMTMTSRSAYVTRPGNLYRAITNASGKTSFNKGDQVKHNNQDGWTIVDIKDTFRGFMATLEKDGKSESVKLVVLNNENPLEAVEFEEYTQQKS